MGLSSTNVKQILLLVNFLLAVLGLVLIGCGIVILVSSDNSTVDHGENLAGGLVITLGVVAVIISIFGCIAAIHESFKKLIIFIICLIVLILLQLIMGSMVSTGTEDGLVGSVHEGFEKLWNYELQEPGSLAFYENWLECCGVNGTADYHAIGHPIPISCCIAHNCSNSENIYDVGCQNKFEKYLYDKFIIFSIVCYILVILEIVAAVLGWMLVSKLQNENRRSRMNWM